MMLARCVRWVLTAAVFASAACASSPEPQFYTLFPEHGKSLTLRPLQVELSRPGLPGYLDRPQIVRHAQPEQLEFSGAAQWGAPLEDMVGSILAQNLAQRLPSARVYTESGSISSLPDARVELDIQRFELTAAGTVELVALVAVHWSTTSGPAGLDRYALSRRVTAGGTPQLVRQMSGLLAELADAIAGSLLSGGPSISSP
jgi:uncharacterized lipoprotein YmbA